ncbi:ubiquinone biosynthesis protein CAT5 [Diplocarpon mali]|nr:ubiquinone biosynthesis protein CAT5 [Diplocarpon mali]
MMPSSMLVGIANVQTWGHNYFSAIVAAQKSVCEFLVPRLHQRLGASRQIRSDETTIKPGAEAASHPAPRAKPLTQAQRDFLSSALRVNQAGELAACRIYNAQTPIVVASHPKLRPLMKHMYDQEHGHFKTFNALIAKHRVRPTAMYPFWKIAASALGWGTAVMGREAAMACTEAVETEIGGHYNEQVGVLLEMAERMEKSGETIGEDLKQLIANIKKIRDEELEHLDHALENDAQKAVPHELLTGVIRAGCRAAIRVSERI